MKLVTEAVDAEGLVDLLESLKTKQDQTEATDTEGDKTLWDALDAWTQVEEIEKAVRGQIHFSCVRDRPRPRSSRK